MKTYQLKNVLALMRSSLYCVKQFTITVNVQSVPLSLNTVLQSLCEVFNSFVDRSLWEIVPYHLHCFLEFCDGFGFGLELVIGL